LVGVNANPACNDTAMTVITVIPEVSIEIPNVFSPNGDGTNDIWFIKSSGIKDMQVDIYNRWGELIKQLFGVNASWDGINLNLSPVTDGTYYYILKATGFDGEQYERHGYILITR
ncbi:MAG: gliding motility-associated C-terminal domain-containing protein, partial [Bacteroidia bacterium]|nr:gliding motility-associated C-terminal domain-containing protein [Bacteroidia bacterium]